MQYIDLQIIIFIKLKINFLSLCLFYVYNLLIINYIIINLLIINLLYYYSLFYLL